MSSGARAVFLDRDGVLNAAVLRNGRPHPPASLEDLEVLAEAVPACERLAAAGYRLIVVTNQPDIARGLQSGHVVDAINERLRCELPLDDFLVCPHDTAEGCDCRKPRPGLLTTGAARWGVDLGRSFMVGDRWSDVEAGIRAGCRTVYIDRGYCEKRPAAPHHTTTSVLAAADWIIHVGNEEKGLP